MPENSIGERKAKMEDALQLVALLVLAVLIAQCHWLKLSRFFYFYLAAQFLFSGMCLVMQHQMGQRSRAYAYAFYLSMLVLAVAVVLLMAWFCRGMHSLSFTVGTLWQAGSIGAWLAYVAVASLKLRGMLSPVSTMHIASSALFLSASLIGLACLLFPVSRIHDLTLFAVTFFIGFWGVDGFLKADLYLRERASAVERVRMSPTVALIILFGSLSLFLFSQQELSRQPSPEAQLMQEIESE